MNPSTHTEKPPRPLNSWLLFRNARQDAVRQERKARNLSIHQADISKALSQEWRELSDIDKRPYELAAEQTSLKHKESYPGYKFSPRSKQQKEAEKQRKKEEAAVRRRIKNKADEAQRMAKLLGTGQVDMHPSTTSYLGACLQAQGFLPPDSGPSTYTSQTPQQIRPSQTSLSPSETPVELYFSHNFPTASSATSSPSSTPTIVPLTAEAGPLSHGIPISAIDESPGYSFDYDFSEALYEKDVLGLGHVDYIDKDPSGPSASTGLHDMASTRPNVSLDTAAILKELEEYYGSTSTTAPSSSVPSNLQDVHISPKQVEPVQPVCVAPSDLTLPEPRRTAAPFRIVKLCTTKDRKNGKYIPRLKRKSKRAKSALSTIRRLIREKDASDADKKTPTEDSLACHLLPLPIDPSTSSAEASSSGYGASPDWTMSDSFDTQYYPWDMPFGDSLYHLLTEDGGFGFTDSSEDNGMPPPSQLWPDDIWDKYFQLDAAV